MEPFSREYTALARLCMVGSGNIGHGFPEED